MLVLAASVEEHRAAHLRWENLVVSENSRGLPFPVEVGDELRNALALASPEKRIGSQETLQL